MEIKFTCDLDSFFEPKQKSTVKVSNIKWETRGEVAILPGSSTFEIEHAKVDDFEFIIAHNLSDRFNYGVISFDYEMNGEQKSGIGNSYYWDLENNL